MSKWTVSEIIEKLESIRERCYEREELEDQDCLQEAIDILYDYDYMAKEITQLQQKEVAAKPERIGRTFTCPVCGRRISFRNSYCHWCGKHLNWEDYWK